MDETTVRDALRQIATTDSRELDRACERVATSLFEQGNAPAFEVATTDFAGDPFLICADRYWRLRFLEVPTVMTAVDCARWLYRWVTPAHRTEIAEKWSLGYAFITRDSVESRDELADATAQIIEQHPGAIDIITFTTLYHAGKLRANFGFDELRQFLESSLLALAVGPRRHDPVFVALQTFAAFGSPSTTVEHAIDLLDEAWTSPTRTRHVIDICLNALAVTTPFPGQGELLRERANTAIDLYPHDHIFHFRLAVGQRLCDDHAAALRSIDSALRLLPAIGNRGSHKLLQEQYIRERDMIMEGMQRSTWAAEQQRRHHDSEQAMEQLHKTAQDATVRAIELVTVFTAAIAFAIGSLQVTLNGGLRLSERLWLLITFGLSLTIFAFLIVGGTWFLTRKRR